MNFLRRLFRRRPSLFDEALVPGAVREWERMGDADRSILLSNAASIAQLVRWEAARGMELDANVVTTIAARAALLVHGRGPGHLRVRTVVVHDSTVVLDGERSGPTTGTRSSGTRRLHGQADDAGLLLLAWDVVERGGRDGRFRYDVVLHEFAHGLDAGDGVFDGTPAVGGTHRDRWVELATSRFEALQRGEDPGVMRPYGATNTAEFFAVAVETLFDRPHRLKDADPEFYAVLVDVVGVDPGPWSLA